MLAVALESTFPYVSLVVHCTTHPLPTLSVYGHHTESSFVRLTGMTLG